MKKNKQILLEILCFLVVTLFLYAAVAKLTDYTRFTVQLQQSPIIAPFSSLAAWLVPSLEIILALMITFSRTRLVALYGSFTLMVMFTLYITAILLFAEKVPCSCGGILEKMTWSTHLIFNAVYVFIILAAIQLHKSMSTSGLSHTESIKSI